MVTVLLTTSLSLWQLSLHMGPAVELGMVTVVGTEDTGQCLAADLNTTALPTAVCFGVHQNDHQNTTGEGANSSRHYSLLFAYPAIILPTLLLLALW